jgi:hypothetical protein
MAHRAATTVELPPLYYLHNFDQMLSTVVEQYSDLLTAEESALLQNLQDLNIPARGLFVRMACRVGPIFRSEKLAYAELGKLSPLANELQSAGLMKVVKEPELDQLLALYRKDELKQIYAGLLTMPSSLNRDQLHELISHCELDLAAHRQAWRGWYEHELWQPLAQEFIELLQLLFFGNRHQSLTDFVLSDLGVARYHPYALDRGQRLFASRLQVEEYMESAQLREIYNQAQEEGDGAALLELIAPLVQMGRTAELEPRWHALRNRVARQLEREKHLDAALQVYRCSAVHPARERQVRILASQKKLSPALNLCQKVLDKPWCEEERDFVTAQIPQLQKKLDLPFEKIAAVQYPESRLHLPNGPERVELIVAQHYKLQWQHVFYSENALFNGLFGLVFWEEIFMPSPGAFVNPFQSAPLDMHSRDFYHRRQTAIESRLQQIEAGQAALVILKNFDRYEGVSNRWLNWRWVTREMLELALEHIPPAALAAVFRRILFDPKSNRSGMPDLVAFDPEHGYRLIEVKGPGDQLQANQKRWFRFFLELKIPFEVVWVEWRDD